MRSYAVFLYSVVNNRLEEYKRLQNESIDDYFVRLYSNRNQYGLSCEQAADLMNQETGQNYGESAYRKRFKAFSDGVKYCEKHISDSYIVEQTRELEKQRIRLQDERAALKRLLREDARKDALLDEIKENVCKFEPLPVYESENNLYTSNGTLLVIISDLHIGLDVANQCATFNSDIAAKYMSKYAEKVVEAAEIYNAKDCVVCIAGDLVAGVIWNTIRAESRERLVKQIKLASEMISKFLFYISDSFKTISVYGVSGNHARPIDKDSFLLGDGLEDLIPYYLKARMSSCNNIKIFESESDTGYSEFKIGNSNFVLVHGDFDTMDEKGIAKLQQLVGKPIQFVVTGHLHENMFKCAMGVHILQGGTLSHGDSYSLKNRLSGKPSQMMAWFDGNDDLSAVMPVYFN